MKFYVTFQAMGDEGRPVRNPEAGVHLTIGSDALGTLPNVGDFVRMDEGDNPVSGRVRSRLFRYALTEKVRSCAVFIVLDPIADDDHETWGLLAH